MIPSKLKPGDEVRVIAPSRSQAIVWQDAHHHAIDFWQNEGFNLTYSKNCRELDQYHSSSIASRVEDLHEAFLDPNVKMVITSLGESENSLRVFGYYGVAQCYICKNGSCDLSRSAL